MSEPRRGRAHDAEGAREAILNAAEEVFAEHGFDGARIAVIAAVANYNSSLIFQYFGDKLGLYTAVLKRSDEEMNVLQARVLAPLLEDENIISDATRFKTFLEIVVQTLFDYLTENPRMIRML
ncbi:MAG: TetR/AcrR family transcriptional regulator, partial [Ktedonobacteraceae bacterium]